MNYIYLALLAPFLFCLSNFVDKYSLSKYSNSTKDFVFFSTLPGWFFIAILLLFKGLPTVSIWSLSAILTGFILGCSYFLYAKSLENSDVSQVVILTQTLSPLTALFGYLFFKQSLGVYGYLALLFVVLGTLCISLERAKSKFILSKSAIWITGAVVLWALLFLTSGKILQHTDFWSYFIFDTLGTALVGPAMLLHKETRKEMFASIRVATIKKYSLYFLNSLLDFFGQMSLKYALMLTPVIAYVTIITEIQSLYALLLGFLFTICIPKIIKEDIKKETIFKKICGIMLLFSGILLLTI